MVEVSVRDQNKSTGGGRDLQAGLSQPLQHEQPARKVGVDENILPPIWTKKLEWPMKVRPIWPLVTSFGLWVWPVLGVTAEWRTRLPNCRARLRSAEFFRVFFSIGGEPELNRPHVGRNAGFRSAMLNSRTNPRRIARPESAHPKPALWLISDPSLRIQYAIGIK